MKTNQNIFRYETNSTSPDDDGGTGFVKCGDKIIVHATSQEGKLFLKRAIEVLNKAE